LVLYLKFYLYSNYIEEKFFKIIHSHEQVFSLNFPPFVHFKFWHAFLVLVAVVKSVVADISHLTPLYSG
jgi:hypothetical protein